MECSPKINSNLVHYWPTMTCAVLYSSVSRLGNTLIGHQSKFGPCLGSRDGGLLHPTACCSSSVSMFRYVMTMRTATSVTESSSSLKDCSRIHESTDKMVSARTMGANIAAQNACLGSIACHVHQSRAVSPLVNSSRCWKIRKLWKNEKKDQDAAPTKTRTPKNAHKEPK